MSDATNSILGAARGVVTNARRRGAGYVGSLLSAANWPKAAYRFAWGPSAPPILQGVFAATAELQSRKPSLDLLRRLSLIPDEPAAVLASDARLEEVERLMDRAHAAGIAGLAPSFTTLVRTRNGALHFGDLSRARRHRPGSVNFAAARDRDRREFNRLFQTALLTEASARAALAALDARLSQSTTPPSIDFGYGLDAGRGARSRNGRVPWERIGRIVDPLVAGRRVLDLGAGNGAQALMMLRAGARDVVAVEADPALADMARLGVRILSWRDMRPYAMHVVTGDMRLVFTSGIGPFDVVTAFGSLSALTEDEITRIVRTAAAMDAVLVVQSNESSAGPAHTGTLDLHQLVRDNGYADVSVHAPTGFSRPLLVAYTDAAARGRHLRASSKL